MKLLFTVSETAHATDGGGDVAHNIRFCWQTQGNYIATTGADAKIIVFDRHGDIVDELMLAGPAQCMSWDVNGDLLAVTCASSRQVHLWDMNTRKMTYIENTMMSGTKDMMTFCCWSLSASVLAVGNGKGSLLIYDHDTLSVETVMGKHSRRITCGAFNNVDQLALGGDDATITLSEADGAHVNAFPCSAAPRALQFGVMKRSTTDKSPAQHNAMSAIVGKRVLMLVDLNEQDNPINLQFQSRYGDLVAYEWYGDGYIVIGFDQGFLITISTHESEIGSEVFSIQDHQSYLSSVSVSRPLDKIATTGDNCVKLREMSQLAQVYAIVELDAEDRGLDTGAFNADGQLFAVSGVSGALHVYVTRLPVMGAALGVAAAILTSLTDITVYADVVHGGGATTTFSIDMEPLFVGIGVDTVAVGTNNRARLYSISGDGATFVRDFEYVGSVHSVSVNHAYIAALLDGRVQLHKLRDDGGADADRQGRVFPDADKQSLRLIGAQLTDDFLIMASESGQLQYFYMDDWAYVNDYRHSTGIRALYPQASGSRVCLLDDKRALHVYNPINDAMHGVPPPPTLNGAVRGVLWETYSMDKDVFIVYDTSAVHTYVYRRERLDGADVVYVASTKLPFGHVPRILYNGDVHCQTQAGRLSTVRLSTHTAFDAELGDKSDAELDALTDTFMLLKRWSAAWRVCEHRAERRQWLRMAREAMMLTDVDLACRIYRHLGDVGTVWSLRSIERCEHRALIGAHLAVHLHQFDMAEQLYLQSPQPIHALEMRRDLLHWDRALQLAARLAPEQTRMIAKEYAQQLEFTYVRWAKPALVPAPDAPKAPLPPARLGDYANALSHYESATSGGAAGDTAAGATTHEQVCEGGIARTAIRQGDIRRGLTIALGSPQRALKKQCAQILENMKQYNEAAQLYEQGRFYDRAAAVCIKAKNWMKVGELLPRVHSPKMHIQYAKAMEAERKYAAAAAAYKSGRDYDNMTRVLLDHLNAPDDAVKIVAETKSVEGAKLVAKYFLRAGEHARAIQFLLLSRCADEAFTLAAEHNQMDVYAEFIGDDATVEQYATLAAHYETRRRPELAGKFYFMARQYGKAINYLMSCGDDDTSIALAIECAAAAADDKLNRKLIDFLMGELDGVPKDAKHIFRLYLSLSMHAEAAKTAIIIAREEQNKGQYRVAHDVLYKMYAELSAARIDVPHDMRNSLMMIHSYLCIKPLIKRGEHMMAARLLVRVCDNISRFPAHAVQVLTSCVIECTKVGMRAAAYKYAATLMRAEYRKTIDDKYRKKMEQMVRKQERDLVDLEDTASPCPYCEHVLADSALNCTQCKNTIAYCIVTAKHMSAGPAGVCTSCRFAGLATEMRRLETAFEPCPMCAVTPVNVRYVDDVTAVDQAV